MADSYENEIVFENEEELEDLEYSVTDGRPIFDSVRVTKKDFSVFELARKYQKKQLILDVDFQRKYVWKIKQKCELIESIFMGLPLPIFYFKQKSDATYVVVDGKQRLSTLFEFLNNGFALKNLKILSFLNGKRFDDLTGDFGIYQSQLEDYQIYSHVILPPTPDKVLFDIFDRVNRGGTKLNKQEIRNALYHGRGLDMIIEITNSEEFINATRITSKKDTRMKGSYLVTRFVSFYLLFQGLLYRNGKEFTYTGDLDDLIEFTLKILNGASQEDLDQIRQLSEQCLAMSYEVFGRGAFRKECNESNPINMNIFETTLYFMSFALENESRISDMGIKERILGVIGSDDFLACIGDGRDSVIKVTKRFGMMKELYEGMTK